MDTPIEKVLPDISEAISFPNSRTNLVIEIGSGGPATVATPKIQEYLKTTNANLLDIDKNPTLKPEMEKEERIHNWFRALNEDIFKVEIKEKANEVWTRNFHFPDIDMLDPQKQERAFLDYYEKVFELLKQGGIAVIVNTYDQYPEHTQLLHAQLLDKAGFKVKRIDLDTNEHPFIASQRRIDLFGKPEKVYPYRTMGFIATKP